MEEVDRRSGIRSRSVPNRGDQLRHQSPRIQKLGPNASPSGQVLQVGGRRPEGGFQNRKSDGPLVGAAFGRMGPMSALSLDVPESVGEAWPRTGPARSPEGDGWQPLSPTRAVGSAPARRRAGRPADPEAPLDHRLR
eukprot:4628393-Pyramimonas_sp.AAC.1